MTTPRNDDAAQRRAIRRPNRQLTKRAPSPETVRHAPERPGEGFGRSRQTRPASSERTAFRRHLAISREFSEVGR
jgi:hypothetical protein